MKFFRLLGVSPETDAEDIRKTFLEVGIGEVIEIKKGILDEKRPPGVSNGTWSLRVKIADPEKYIPSYIHRRDEGEIWSLNFEGRVFCCWKCGSGNHIGDKCRDQTRTFEEVFNGSASDEDFAKPTWAAVVRTGKGVSDIQEQRTREMEQRLKDANKRHRSRSVNKELIAAVAATSENAAALVSADPPADMTAKSQTGQKRLSIETVSDSQVLAVLAHDDGQLLENDAREVTNVSNVDEDLKGVSGTPEASPEGGQKGRKDGDLSLVFGPGASKLQLPKVADQPESGSDKSVTDTSTPIREKSRGRRRMRHSGRSSICSPSPVRAPDVLKKIRLQKKEVSDGGGNMVEQQEDLLDPGDKGEASSTNLEESEDWGDSFEQETDAAKDGNMLQSQTETPGTSSVDQDSGNTRVLR